MLAKGLGLSLWFVFAVLFTCCWCTDPNATEIDEEAAAFKRFEDRIVSLMKNVRRQVLPFLTKAVLDIKLTPMCMRTLTKLNSDLTSLKSWALKMVDSGGKIPSGVLKGSMVMLGNYDECLEIMEPAGRGRRDVDIFGKYCLTFLYVPQTLLTHLTKFSKGNIRNTSSTERFKEVFDIMSRYKFDGTAIHFRFGACIPSTCSEEDLMNVLNYGLEDSGMTVEIRNCDMKSQFAYTTDQIIILCVFGLIFTLVIAGTVCDFVFPTDTDTTGKSSSVRDRAPLKILLHFSIPFNIEKLLSDEYEEEKHLNIPCIRGLAILMFCFYMVVNSYAMIDEHAMRSYGSSINYFSILKEPLFAVIANSMIYVDSMFAIAGFLIFYRPQTTQGNSNDNTIKSMILKVIFRWISPILATTGVFLLLPVFGDGPAFHEVLDVPLSSCRKNWWANILFINNFLKLEDQCMLHLWFIGCLAQLLIIGFFLKYIISRWTKIGFCCLVVLVVACNSYLGISTVQQRLPPTMSMYFIFSMKTVKHVAETIFFLPHGHLGAFAIGMCAGYWLQHHPHWRLKNGWKFAIWAVVVTLFCCLVFGLYPYHDGTEMANSALGLYSSLHGIVFSIMVSLMLVITLRAPSDFVSRTLSTKYFLPMVKLLYYAYLLHWAVIFFHIAIARERHFLSHYEQVSRSFGHIFATFALAFLFYVLFNGLFTLDEVLVSMSSSHASKGTSSLKTIFSRKRFQVQQQQKVHGVANEIAMQSTIDVPE